MRFSDAVAEQELVRQIAELERRVQGYANRQENLIHDLGVCREAFTTLHHAPELNMGNYSEDQVERLNNDMICAYLVMCKVFEVEEGASA